MMDAPLGASLGESCCCLELKPRADIASWMLLDDLSTQPQSLMQKFLCHCQPEARVNSGIEKVPQIASLAGATLQRGTHSTAGSVQTLKWAAYDPATRTAVMEVFGGFGGTGQRAQWTEPDKGTWYFLMNLARFCNYSYRFKFSEDYRRADIDILANCTGCCCVPCVPAWCAVPGFLAKFEMVQTDDSKDGSLWKRNSSSCGKPMEYTYDLAEVMKADGSPGRFYDDLAKFAPENMLISR